MIRKIIHINHDLCDGCGNCIPGCPEGALQVLDGKARLISDLFCDGLGACLGECPAGAITVEEREAEPYDEKRVMANIVKQGSATIGAHLAHLRDHGETGYLREALSYLAVHGHDAPAGFEAGLNALRATHPGRGCPGSMSREIMSRQDGIGGAGAGEARSELTQWPIQLHLINPLAPYFEGADLLIAADCAPFSFAGFHQELLKGRKLIIFCPKLDQGIETYIEKLEALFARQNIRTVTVAHMEVPCCFGARKAVEEALAGAGKSIPLEDITISISGVIATRASAAGR